MSEIENLSPQELALVDKITKQVHKTHNRAIWRTRILVSFITSLTISCLISIGVSSILIHNSKEDALTNSRTNCHNITKLKDVGIKTNETALSVILSLGKAEKNKTSKEKQQYIASVNYYTSVLNQYRSIKCDSLK